MRARSRSAPRLHLRTYLVSGYALLLAYVSLSPFVGWQDQGLSFIDVLTAPLAQTFTWFDFFLNYLAYIPLGILLAYVLRIHRPAAQVLLLAALCGLMLSVAMEYAQMYLPSRVSSNSDLLSNSSGTLTGAVIALLIAQYSGYTHIASWHDKWFKHGWIYDFGLALLAMWMFAQTNPSLPMLGSVFVGGVARWPFDIVPESPFNWLECTEVALNLLLLGILLSTLLRERRHMLGALLLVLCMVTLVKFVAAAVLLKSWALLIWLNSEAILGIIAGLLLLAAVMRFSRDRLHVYGALAAVFYLALLQDLLYDEKPSTAMRLYHWHYTHMLNYNGLSQLVITLLPVLLLVYLWRTGLRRK